MSQPEFIYSLTLSHIYLLAVGLYRLSLSPISSIPGSRIPAITWLSESYDSIRGRQNTSHPNTRPARRQVPRIQFNPSGLYTCEPDSPSEAHAPHPRRRARWRSFTKELWDDGPPQTTVDCKHHPPRRRTDALLGRLGRAGVVCAGPGVHPL